MKEHPMATPVVRIVIVDSDLEHRAALKRVLAPLPSVTLVGEFADISTAAVEAPARHPDIAIVEAPGANHEERTIPALDRLARALSETSIVATGPTT